MIRFTDATILEETIEENFLIPSEKFRLRSHSDLLSLMDKIDVLPEMIGFLCKVDTPAPSGANQSKRVILHICMEEGINLSLTIWDALVDSFATKFSEIDERYIVIIATSILQKSFGDRMFIMKLKTTLKTVRAKPMIPMNIELLKYYPSSTTKKSRINLPFMRALFFTNNGSLEVTPAVRYNFNKIMDEDTVQVGRDRVSTSVLNIVGKTYKFQVKVTPYNFRAKYQFFTVSRIMNISEPATEEHLQKKISVIEEVESSCSPNISTN
ncbi:hypothetical protein ACS0TY_000595 [Phlomoides rotata]